MAPASDFSTPPRAETPIGAIESDLDVLRGRLLQRIEETNQRFQAAQDAMKEATERLRTIEELRAEAHDLLAAARQEAASIVARAHAERELSALHVDHHVETGKAMAELETAEFLSRTIARAREAERAGSESIARVQGEMDRFVQDEVQGHEREIARLHERQDALRARMIEVLRSVGQPPSAVLDLDDPPPDDSASEIFDAIDGWVANRLS